MKKLPRIITQPEFEELFAATIRIERKLKSFTYKMRVKKYRLALLLGFEAGMRISEIVGYKDKVPALTKDRVDTASIKILSGKGGKDRIVPKPRRMNQAAINLLPLDIQRRSLQDFVTKLSKSVLKKKISFHTLRHGFITHLVNRGLPLHEVQMLAGHSRLDTTGIYLHANPEKALRSAQEAF